MNEYERMQTSMERHANAKVYSDTARFSGKSLRKIYADIGKALAAEDEGKGEARMLVRDGRKENGEPETWVHLKVGTEDVGTTNVSSNCPPLPPEYCQE